MAGMHKAVSERHGMTTIAALVAIVAMIFASVIAAPQRAYAEEYNISDLGWVDKDDTSFEISSDGGKTTPSTATKWWPPTPAANRRGPTSKRS